MVAVGFELSMPSNVTVPLGSNCRLAGLGAVMPTVIIIFWTAATPFTGGPPRLGMVQIIMLPPSPGAGAPHEAGFAPADGVTVTELMVKMLSMVIVNTTLLAAVDELFPTVQVRIPVPPGLTVEGVALPETETGTCVVGGGGGSEG